MCLCFNSSSQEFGRPDSSWQGETSAVCQPFMKTSGWIFPELVTSLLFCCWSNQPGGNRITPLTLELCHLCTLPILSYSISHQTEESFSCSSGNVSEGKHKAPFDFLMCVTSQLNKYLSSTLSSFESAGEPTATEQNGFLHNHIKKYF